MIDKKLLVQALGAFPLVEIMKMIQPHMKNDDLSAEIMWEQMIIKAEDLERAFIWLFENSSLNMDALKTDEAIEINKLYKSLTDET